jgi:hypothetical protein
MKFNHAGISAKISEANKFNPQRRSEKRIKKALKWVKNRIRDWAKSDGKRRTFFGMGDLQIHVDSCFTATEISRLCESLIKCGYEVKYIQDHVEVKW